MKPLAIRTSDFRLTDRLSSLMQNYRYLTEYFASGSDDPERHEVLDRLIAETFLLYDDISAALSTPSALLLQMQSKAADYVADDDKYRQLKSLFYRTWLQADDKQPDLLTPEERSMYVSALSLNILSRFSESKILLMLDLAQQYDGEERQRAVVSLVLVLHRYNSRLPFFPNIVERIRTMQADSRLRDDILHVCRLLLETSLTPLLNKEMESLSKDIIPQISKSNDPLVTLEELDEENPKWSQGLKNSFQKHFDEMTRLHSEGGDITYSSTRGILTDGFFHNDIANWFMPFGQDNPEIGIDFESPDAKLLKGVLLANAESCDTDRYAMCCIFHRIQGQLSNKKLPSVVNDMSEFGNMHSFENSDPKKQALSYVRVLYRFFFHNPWKIYNMMQSVTFVCNGVLFRTLCPRERVSTFGDRCLALGLYAEAAQLFGDDSAVDMQKRGYALQKQHLYAEALPVFRKAMLIDDDKWTMQHAAYCLRKLGKTGEALEIYETLLSSDPDNKKYLLQKAQCLLDSEQFDKALPVFYQLDLLYPDDSNIQRGLAWCAFVTADSSNTNYSIAETYMEKAVYGDVATVNDYINYGHLLLCTGHRKEAIETYQRVIRLKDGAELFLRQMEQDAALLSRKGITDETLTLVTDSALMTSAGQSPQN